MKVPVTTALRAELSRARANNAAERVALFVLDLGDEGDLPAWELAAVLAPDKVQNSPDRSCTVVVGAVPLLKLARTLQRAGERELSVALRKSDFAGIPVVLLHDVVRTVKPLNDVEAEEAELLLCQRPAGVA